MRIVLWNPLWQLGSGERLRAEVCLMGQECVGKKPCDLVLGSGS